MGRVAKRKWYLPIFIIGVLSVLGIIILLYRQFHLEAYFSILVSITVFLGGTIILSFFHRDKISISFLYNFRTEKYRKDKMKEFEKDFLKDNPEPLKKNYTDIK